MGVISLELERDMRKLRSNREQLYAVLNNHRQALTRLFETGVIFHRQGVKAGRDLLLAHELLHRVLDQLDELGSDDLKGEPKARLMLRIQRDLTRASVITARTGEKLRSLLPPQSES